MTPQQLIQRYQELGFKLLYWPRVENDPTTWKGPRSKGWNDPNRAYPLDAFDPNSMNLGVFTGTEVAPGRFLVDIDLDWPGGLALASLLLPPSKFAFGRKGKKISHVFYTTPETLPLATYDDIEESNGVYGDGNGERIVELRSGIFSHQTMIAPSLHSPGTTIDLVLPGDILHVESRRLQEAVIDYAIACLLLKHVRSGLHHDGRVALAGLLLNAHLSPARVTAIIEAVCKVQVLMSVPDMTEKDVNDASLVVRTTLQRIEKHKQVAGGPKLAEFIGQDRGKAVVKRLLKWLNSNDAEFVLDNKGRVIARHQQNIQRAIELLKYDLTYNEFADKLLMNNRPLEDPQWIPLLLEIEREYKFSPPVEYFKMVIKDLAWRNKFHPVKQYLDSLTWDQEPRLDTWLITSAKTIDTPYVRAISAIMLIAAVRRIRQPGCKYDEMMVWESRQGTNKSSAAQALCPNPAWFSDDLRLNLHSQQLIEATLGKWIVEASELSGKRKTEIEQLKAMMSRQVDGPARMAYAHFPVERPRHFIIIGTTNSSVYLNDSTGARRFWPVAVHQFDIKWIIANRDQLWAEAAAREAAGEPIRLAEELWGEAGEEQSKRREIDPWEDLIREALMALEPGSGGRRRISANAVWDAVNIPIEKRDRFGAMRISEIMQRLGLRRTTVREDNVVRTGYITEDSALLDSTSEDDDEVSRVKGESDEDIPF